MDKNMPPMPPMATAGEGYGYTEEEWLFKMNLRKFIEEEVDPRFMEARDPEKADALMHEWMKRLGDMGALRACNPEFVGGLGMGLNATMILTEECTRGNGALGIHAMETATLCSSLAMSFPQMWEKIGDKLLDGEWILDGFQNSPEGQCNFPEQADIATFDEEAQEWVLNGEKPFSSGATGCDVLSIMGLYQGAQYMFFFPDPWNTPGLTITPHWEIGCAPYSASASMRNVRVPKELGAPMPTVVDRKMLPQQPMGKLFPLGCAALALGSMSGAYDKTVEFLMHRTSNFQPIASIGLIQDKLVRMKERMEAARSFLIVSTKMIEENHKDALVYVPLCKAFVCDTARWITSECVQLHGSVAVDPGTGIERYMQDAACFGIGVCGSEMHRATAAKYMGLPNTEFECL